MERGTRWSFTYQGHSTLLAFGHLYVSEKVGRVTSEGDVGAVPWEAVVVEESCGRVNGYVVLVGSQ